LSTKTKKRKREKRERKKDKTSDRGIPGQNKKYQKNLKIIE